MNCRTTACLGLLGLAFAGTVSSLAAQEATPTSIQRETNLSSISYDHTEIVGAKPWTHEAFRNNPDNFQFAILGDRGGGASPLGTYEKAIEQLNWLQPEFVMSVGDYVEGYTTNQQEMERQWNEFDAMIGNLQMPFFFVRGNHDINLPATRQAWKERRGPQYYHFTYKNVLFVVLDTEDAQRPIPPHMERDLAKYNRLKTEDPKKAMAFMIEWMETPEAQAAFGQSTQIEFPAVQVDWFQQVIKTNSNVRWTFVFLHEPVWNNPSESFRKIVAAIQDRNCTFFAGHAHYYDYDLIDGHEYITVASAGAAFTRTGPGNVDHMTWVTMTQNGPEIAGIALKGIFDRRGLDPQMFGAYDRIPPQVPDFGMIRAAPGQSLGLKSMPNLRDLGGYETVDGSTVLKGLLYRASQPCNLHDDELEKLKELGLKSAFDLRTFDERKAAPGELPSDVNYVWLDVLGSSPESGPALLEKLLTDPPAANAQLGDGKVEQLFLGAYRDFVRLPSARLELRKLFLSLTDKRQVPALFHCTTGKDRTGWAAAALLTLLGVPHETVLKDYLRSNEYILPQYADRIDQFAAAGGDPRIPAAIFGVKAEYLQASLDEVKSQYGTIENYFSDGLGVDVQQQQALRNLFLDMSTQVETSASHLDRE